MCTITICNDCGMELYGQFSSFNHLLWTHISICAIVSNGMTNHNNVIIMIEHMKIIIIGDGQVGKTSLVRRFVDSKYDPDYRQTIGVAFKEKQQYIPEPINEAGTYY